MRMLTQWLSDSVTQWLSSLLERLVTLKRCKKYNHVAKFGCGSDYRIVYSFQKIDPLGPYRVWWSPTMVLHSCDSNFPNGPSTRACKILHGNICIWAIKCDQYQKWPVATFAVLKNLPKVQILIPKCELWTSHTEKMLHTNHGELFRIFDTFCRVWRAGGQATLRAT